MPETCRGWLLVNDQRDAQIIFYVFIYNSPYVSSTSCSSSGETNCINTASGNCHSAHHQERHTVSIQPLVTVTLCWWPRCVQVGRRLLPTCTHLGHQHRVTVTRGCIDTVCLSWWWARCARNMWRVINKYIEKNLCITLVIYQESTSTCFGHICSPSSGEIYLHIIIMCKTYCCYLHLLKVYLDELSK